MLALFLAGSALAACGSSHQASTSPLKPPVITNDSTHEPCSQTSQISMDYCAGDQLLAADHLINAQMALVWLHTPSSTERRQLVVSEKAWLAWRGDNCAVVSTAYKDGSIEPLEYADCETSADGTYSETLHSLFLFEWQGDAYQWQWPTAATLAEHADG
jgi:uncharacterized protein YecT (DUF1311 family)